jgi:hypothetical protein
MFVLQGLFLLLSDMYPTRGLMIIFRLPFALGTGIVLGLINWKFASYKMLEIVNLVKTKYIRIIVYTCVAILLYLYSSMIGKLF